MCRPIYWWYMQNNNVCQFLPFTDDIETFHAINSCDGCTQVKWDTDCIQGWCTGNFMTLHISRTQTSTFSSKINTFVFKYKLEDSYINHIHCVVCYVAYDGHLANYTLYNRFLHNIICCHNTLFTKWTKSWISNNFSKERRNCQMMIWKDRTTSEWF